MTNAVVVRGGETMAEWDREAPRDARPLARVEPAGVMARGGGTLDLQATLQLAKVLMTARGFVPDHIKTEGALVATILSGQEMGLPPMCSLRGLYMVNGKVGFDASLQLALVKRAGIRHTWLKDGSDGQEARLRLDRAGDAPYEHSYTRADAQTAQLWGKGAWSKHPAAMLRARCVTAAIRAYCPDVLGGPVYDLDEIQEIAREEPPLSAPVAQQISHGDDDMARRIAEAREAEAQAEAEWSPTVDAWIQDLEDLAERVLAEALDAHDVLGAFLDRNGGAMRQLPRKLRTKLWGKLGGNKSSVANRLGVTTDTVKHWIAEAPDSDAPEDELLDGAVQ
jgi:hypothetical protein